MLNTTRLFRRMLTVGYAVLISCKLFQLALFASVYHARREFSASGCFFQNDFSVFTEMILTDQLTSFPKWEQGLFLDRTEWLNQRAKAGRSCPLILNVPLTISDKSMNVFPTHSFRYRMLRK